MEKVWDVFGELRAAIHGINEKYRTPRIKVTPMVSFWLLMLRLYLLGMLVLLGYKFATLVWH